MRHYLYDLGVDAVLRTIPISFRASVSRPTELSRNKNPRTFRGFKATCRARSDDLRFTKPPLYQLS